MYIDPSLSDDSRLAVYQNFLERVRRGMEESIAAIVVNPVNTRGACPAEDADPGC